MTSHATLSLLSNFFGHWYQQSLTKYAAKRISCFEAIIVIIRKSHRSYDFLYKIHI